MNKIEIINNMAVSLSKDNYLITPEELETLLSMANSQIEKDLYVEIYNFLLRKRSEEVIKNGKF